MPTPKRLVLTYPNLRWFKVDPVTTWNLNPATLCLLGAVAKEVAEVSVVDGQFEDLTLEVYVERVLAESPDFVGISVLSSEYGRCLHMAAEAIKERSPETVIIAGGIHVTREYEAVMADRNIDYAVLGEGEYVLRDLIAHLSGEGGMPTEGVARRNGAGLQTGPKVMLDDLGALPMPDYGLIDMHDFSRRAFAMRLGPTNPPEMPGVRISVSRGCPLDCSFCQVSSISGKHIRSRDAAQVVEELTLLRDRYGVRSFIFDDDNLVGKKRYFKDLLDRMIEAELGLTFIVGAFAIFAIDDEMLDLMARAGCVGVNIAIESGCQRVMNDIVRKPVDLETVPDWIARIKESGIFVASNFIIGFPGESWDEIRQTIHFAETCGAEYVKLFIATPLPGTGLWRMAEELGLLRMNGGEGWGERSGHGTAEIVSEQWTAEDLRILRAYEWDRINFGLADRRRRTAEIWNVDETTIEQIRKETRDSVSESLS